MIEHVFLRGKIYWWRRRVPTTAQHARSIRIELSLRTKSLACVKIIAPEITALFNSFRQNVLDGTMTRAEVKQTLTAKVASLIKQERTIPKPNAPLETRGNDYACERALKLYFAEMSTPETATEEINRFLRETHENEMYDAVAVRVLFLKRIKFGNIVERPSDCPDRSTADSEIFEMNLSVDVNEFESGAPKIVQSSEDQLCLPKLIARAAHEKVATCEWTKKTAQQHIKLASLFVKFVGHDDPRRMGQSHIAQFRSFLIRLPKNYGKSSRDAGRSVADLMSRSKVPNAPHNGLSNGTINRHMTQMANIVNLCSHSGVPFASYHGVSGLRVKQCSDLRSARGKFSTAEIESIFELPVWRGCASGLERLKPGPMLIHDSLYWLPILAAYTGARRAELCDLLTSDIRFSEHHNVYYVDIAPREHRRLKNIQSQRQLPLHQELIRLGFITYVETLRNEAFLFPDLRKGSGRTSAGDIFNKSWQKIRAASLPNAKAEKKVFHSFRHWCNNEMKQSGVSAEIRKDFLGHNNSGVNEGRYTETARLGLMADAVKRLPTPTASVRSFPINLGG